MLNSAEKNQLLKEVLESPEFKDSERYKELFQYLVKATIAGAVPKEITIGTEFFHKGPDFDPKDDPTVRVYINNLRKKIDHFYLTSNVDHAYKIDIPKGHYQIEFVPIVNKPKIITKQLHRYRTLVVAAAVSLIVIAISGILYFSQSRQIHYNTHPLLDEFLTPGSKPTLIVLGDFFFLFERNADGKARNFIRNIDVNSIEDFREQVKKDPKFAAHYVQSDFTFLRPSASWGLAQILPIFQNSPNGYSMKLASQFTIDDLKSHNVVFIGSFKTLYGIHKFLHIFGIDYTLSPNRVEIHSVDPDSIRYFSPKQIQGGNYEKDFAIVAKGKGPEGGSILLLLGFSDSGVIEASRIINDPQMIATILEKIQKGPTPQSTDFTLVVETEGLMQAIFKSQIVHFVQMKTAGQSSPIFLQDSTKKQ